MQVALTSPVPGLTLQTLLVSPLHSWGPHARRITINCCDDTRFEKWKTWYHSLPEIHYGETQGEPELYPYRWFDLAAKMLKVIFLYIWNPVVLPDNDCLYHFSCLKYSLSFLSENSNPFLPGTFSCFKLDISISTSFVQILFFRNINYSYIESLSSYFISIIISLIILKSKFTSTYLGSIFSFLISVYLTVPSSVFTFSWVI